MQVEFEANGIWDSLDSSVFAISSENRIILFDQNLAKVLFDYMLFHVCKRPAPSCSSFLQPHVGPESRENLIKRMDNLGFLSVQLSFPRLDHIREIFHLVEIRI